MKKALQQFEKKVRTAYEFSQQGLNYRCNVRVNDVMIGNISMNLTKSNQIANMLISEIFDNKSFNVHKDKSDLIFQNNFDELKTLETTTSYYPETGFLVFDQNLKTLKIHLTRESQPCEGVLLGYVMNSQSLHILQQLRELDGSCKLFIEGSYNFYLKRTLNILLGVSLIYFLNGITFDPKNEVTSLFVRNEKELQYVQKQN